MEQQLQITGTVKKVFETVSGTGKNNKAWKRRDVLITQDGQYPKDVLLSAIGKTCEVLDHVGAGTRVKASISLESREYNSKYYSTITAYYLERETAVQETKQEVKQEQPDHAEESDTLPF